MPLNPPTMWSAIRPGPSLFIAIVTIFLTTLGIAAPASAQPALTGIVVSSADSTPVPRATVTVETWDGQFVAEATTGADGQFRIAFEEPRTVVVSAAGPGFARSELQRVDLDPDDPTEIRLEVTPREVPEPRPRLPEVEAAAGEIAGRVIDASSGRPLPGATVALLARRDDERIATVTSGPGGEFRIRVPESTTYRLRADLGEFGRSETLIVEGSTERGLSLTLELISDPVELEAITAEGRREIFWWQQEKSVFVWPYYERRHRYGRLRTPGRWFYDGEYLKQNEALGVIGFVESHMPPRAMLCQAPIVVYADGWRIGEAPRGQLTGAARDILGVRTLDEVEGVEVYLGMEVPPDLHTPETRDRLCAVVSVYFRR